MSPNTNCKTATDHHARHNFGFLFYSITSAYISGTDGTNWSFLVNSSHSLLVIVWYELCKKLNKAITGRKTCFTGRLGPLIRPSTTRTLLVA